MSPHKHRALAVLALIILPLLHGKAEDLPDRVPPNFWDKGMEDDIIQPREWKQSGTALVAIRPSIGVAKHDDPKQFTVKIFLKPEGKRPVHWRMENWTGGIELYYKAEDGTIKLVPDPYRSIYSPEQLARFGDIGPRTTVTIQPGEIRKLTPMFPREILERGYKELIYGIHTDTGMSFTPALGVVDILVALSEE